MVGYRCRRLIFHLPSVPCGTRSRRRRWPTRGTRRAAPAAKTHASGLRADLPPPIHMRDRLQLHVIVEPARPAGPSGPTARRYARMRCTTAEDAAALDVELGIIGEQRGGFAPQALVEIEAVDALQVLDVVLVGQLLRLRQPAVRCGCAVARCRRYTGVAGEQDGFKTWILAAEMEGRREGTGPGLVLRAGRCIGLQAVADETSRRCASAFFAQPPS